MALAPQMPSTYEAGTGEAVLFANSAVTDYTMFQPQLDALVPAYRVIAHNTRSLTDNWQEPYTLWDLADEWKLLLDERGIDRAVVVGSSMGGYMALRFALRYPERTAGVVLIGSTAQSNTPDEVVAFLEKFGELEGVERMPHDWAEWVSHIVFSEAAHRERPELPAAWIDRWVSMYPGEAFVEEARCWVLREDITPRLGEIEAPVLVVHGEDDGAIPLARATVLDGQLADSEVVVVPGAGHLVNLEKPEIVTEAIQRFLGRVYA